MLTPMDMSKNARQYTYIQTYTDIYIRLEEAKPNDKTLYTMLAGQAAFQVTTQRQLNVHCALKLFQRHF